MAALPDSSESIETGNCHTVLSHVCMLWDLWAWPVLACFSVLFFFSRFGLSLVSLLLQAAEYCQYSEDHGQTRPGDRIGGF